MRKGPAVQREPELGELARRSGDTRGSPLACPLGGLLRGWVDVGARLASMNAELALDAKRQLGAGFAEPVGNLRDVRNRHAETVGDVRPPLLLYQLNKIFHERNLASCLLSGNSHGHPISALRIGGGCGGEYVAQMERITPNSFGRTKKSKVETDREFVGAYKARQENLRRLIETRADGKQVRFAEMADLAVPHVSQMKTGKRAMGDEVARRIEERLSLPKGFMDTQNGDAFDSRPLTSEAKAWMIGHGVEAYEEVKDLPADRYAHIPAYTMEVGAGGRVNYHVTKDGVGDAYRIDWLVQRGLNSQHLFKVQVIGDSMENRLMHGSWVMVDKSQKDVIDNKIYVIRYGDEVRVKTLYKRPDGGIVISSENKRYPEITVSPEDMDHIDIIGRVVHVDMDI